MEADLRNKKGMNGVRLRSYMIRVRELQERIGRSGGAMLCSFQKKGRPDRARLCMEKPLACY